MPHADLCKVMHIARGPVEWLRPVNAGLLFFNSNPHRFFNRAWIELAIHKDDVGRNFASETFKGPLHGYSGDADPPCPVMLTPLKDYGSENLND